MRIILFYHEDTAILGKNFKDNIGKQWTGTEIEIFQTVNSLKYRMKHNLDFFENEVYVILVDSKSRLLELLLISDLMDDKNLILVLPDESEETTRLATHLYPRFITHISEKYEDLHLVLQQMADKEKVDGNKKPGFKTATNA